MRSTMELQNEDKGIFFPFSFSGVIWSSPVGAAPEQEEKLKENKQGRNYFNVLH